MTNQCKAELIFRTFNYDCELERGHFGKHRCRIFAEDWQDGQNDASVDFEVRWK